MVLKDRYSPELTAASLAKFTISPVGLGHSPGCEKFESLNLKKIYFFLRISYLLPTYQETLLPELSTKY